MEGSLLQPEDVSRRSKDPSTHLPLRGAFGRDDDLIGTGMWGREALANRPHEMRSSRELSPVIDLRSIGFAALVATGIPRRFAYLGMTIVIGAALA